MLVIKKEEFNGFLFLFGTGCVLLVQVRQTAWAYQSTVTNMATSSSLLHDSVEFLLSPLKVN